MKYTNDAVLRAEQTLSERQQRSEEELAERERYVYSQLPEVKDMRESLSKSYFELMRIIASHDPEAARSAEIVKEKNLLTQKRIGILVGDLTGDPAYLEPRFVCEKCRDTGYVEGQRCSCLLELMKSYTVQELNEKMTIELHDFSEFDMSFYEDPADRERMTKWLGFLKSYCADFPNSKGSLLFSGATGLGKTFLSACMAKALAERGYEAAFGSAYEFLRRIENEHFRRAEGDTLGALIAADMVIIDDLGSEMSLPFYEATLYNLLNSRLNLGKPTVISTNLTMQQINQRYHDRIASRLVGSFIPMLFSGKDIRQQMAQRRFDKMKP